MTSPTLVMVFIRALSTHPTRLPFSPLIFRKRNLNGTVLSPFHQCNISLTSRCIGLLSSPSRLRPRPCPSSMAASVVDLVEAVAVASAVGRPCCASDALRSSSTALIRRSR